MLEGPPGGPEKEGKAGDGVWTWSLISQSPKLGAMSLAPHNQSSKVLAETEPLRTAQTLGWAVPLDPSVLHSLFTKILQPHRLPVQAPGEQELLHQAEDWQPSHLPFPSSPSVQET